MIVLREKEYSMVSILKNIPRHIERSVVSSRAMAKIASGKKLSPKEIKAAAVEFRAARMPKTAPGTHAAYNTLGLQPSKSQAKAFELAAGNKEFGVQHVGEGQYKLVRKAI